MDHLDGSQGGINSLFSALGTEDSTTRRCKDCDTRFTNHTGPTCSECGGELVPLADEQKKRVLLVEDAPLDQMKFAALFKQLGCRVETAENGNLALNVLEKTKPGERPDLIVLDLLMPRKGGIQVLKQLRSDRRFRLIPVVILTDSSDQRLVRAALRGAPTDYLLKSSDPDQLRERFRRLLEL